jgi:hypothetical protein
VSGTQLPIIPTLPLRLQTELSYRDYEEGVLAVQVDAVRARQRQAASRHIGLMNALVAMAVTGAVLMAAFKLDSKRNERGDFYLIGNIVVPTLIFSFLAARLSRQLNRRIGGAVSMWQRVLGVLRVLRPWLVIAASLGFIWWVSSKSPRPDQTNEFDWFGVLVPHVMWIVMTVIYFSTLARNVRPGLRQVWESSPSLARPNVVTIDEGGVTFDDGTVSRTYRWEGFIRFRETSSNFLLCPSESSFEAIAKRAFEDPVSATAAGVWLNHMVQPPDIRPKAFPVIPTRSDSLQLTSDNAELHRDQL